MADSPGAADGSPTRAVSTDISLVAKDPEREPNDAGCESTKTRLKLDVSDANSKPAKRPKPDSGLRMIEHAEQWVEKDDDFVFDKTKIILRQGDSVFMATTDKTESGLKELDLERLERLDRIQIPPEHFCPAFKEGLTRASEPISADIYVKRPRLLSWDPENNGSIAALVLQEAEVCELLRQHPHPNIAQYHGRLVDNGRITGLCFTKYKLDVEKAVGERKDITEKEKLAYSKATEDGTRHLHHLGLAHNDINPSNIMMDGEKPAVIDFDSTNAIAEKLGDKGGTFQWEREGAGFSGLENNGLRKIQEVTLQVKSQEVEPEK